jgi:hypothetical protein
MKHKLYTISAIALLLMAALAMGCAPSIPEGYTPPPGMGAVRVNLNENIVRSTILPDSKSIGDFLEFDLDFMPGATPNGAVQETKLGVPKANINAPVDLLPGNYKLSVVGYLNTADPSDPPSLTAAAIGETTADFTVTSGGSVNVSVMLYAIDSTKATSGVMGKFTWDINTAGITGVTTLTTATMDITPIGPGSPASNVSLGPLTTGPTNRWSDSTALLPGFYYVDFTLRATTSSPIIYLRHVLQVYQGMNSTFTYAITNGQLNIQSSGTANITVDYTPPEDLSPVLQVAGAAIPGNQVEVDLFDPPTTVTITVSNAATDFTGVGSSIVWRCANAQRGTGTTFTVDVANAPFTAVGLYQLSVTGTTPTADGNKVYSSEVWVKVIDTTP